MLSIVHYICSNGGSPKFRLPAPLIIIDEVHYYYSAKPAPNQTQANVPTRTNINIMHYCLFQSLDNLPIFFNPLVYYVPTTLLAGENRTL